MGNRRPADPAGEAGRATARSGSAGGGDWPTLCPRYVLENGCKWRSRPKDFPPRSTVHGYLQLWAWDGTLERLHHALYIRTREREDREASPTAAIVDSQSIRSAEKGGRSRTR